MQTQRHTLTHNRDESPLRHKEIRRTQVSTHFEADTKKQTTPSNKGTGADGSMLQIHTRGLPTSVMELAGGRALRQHAAVAHAAPERMVLCAAQCGRRTTTRQLCGTKLAETKDRRARGQWLGVMVAEELPGVTLAVKWLKEIHPTAKFLTTESL